MQTIFLATDAPTCRTYVYLFRPRLDEQGQIFYGDPSMLDMPNAPPPGECREYRLVPVEELSDDDTETIKDGIIAEQRERIAELEKQLADRSPGVMPECVAKLLAWFAENPVSAMPVQTRLEAVRDHYAPPAGHEWQPVDAEHPITAEDVGRQVCFGPTTVTAAELPCGAHKISGCERYILRPVAKPFVFDGTPGIYRTDSGKCCDVFKYVKKFLGIIDDDERVWVNPDGTFDGGRIVGRVSNATD